MGSNTESAHSNIEILTEITQALHTSSSLEEIYTVALDLIIELNNVDITGIYLVDEQKNEAVLQAQRNFPEAYLKSASRIPSPMGGTWKVINSGQILNIEDAQKSPELGPAGRALGHHSVLGVPIFLEGKSSGVIWFLSYKERRFDEEEVNFLSTYGTQVAMAIANAKQTNKLKESQQKLKEGNKNLSLLSTFSSKINQPYDLDSLYTKVLNIAEELEFIDIIAVYLIEGEGDKREAVLQINRGYSNEYLKRASRIPYPKGVTWETINRGEPVYYEDASRTSTTVGPAGKALGQRALLCIPIKTEEGENIGIIGFSSFDQVSFTTQELDFLKSLGNQIGIAIAKAKLYEELVKNHRYETIIRTVIQSVHRSINLQEVLENAVEAMYRNINGVDNVSIYFVEGEEAVMKAYRGYPDWFIERVKRIPYPKGFTWKTIMDGEPRYVADVEQDTVIGPSGREMGTKSYAAMPISFKGERIGVININSLQKNVFSKHELELLEKVSKQIETAISNARQAEEIEKRNKELEILNAITGTVHQSFNLQEIYDIALDKVTGLEYVDIASVYLVDEESGEAILEAHRNFPQSFIERAGRIPYPKGVTWKVINTGDVLNVKNARNDPDVGPAGRDLGFRSMVGIPIIINRETVGVIWFLSYKEHIFTKSEEELLTSIGKQIAIAIARAKTLDEIKSTQQQLIQSERLATLGQLISGIAHEINNPLTPILGYSQNLLRESDFHDKAKEGLKAIHDSAKRIKNIVEKLLSFSRKHIPTRTYEDINSLVEKSIEFREYQLHINNIEIVKDLDPGLPKTMVDSNQIEQVFLNILVNAEQAMKEADEGGQLTVKTRRKSKGSIGISFSDDGPGIPKKVLGNIFDPFFTTKPTGEGTGLGLSVSYGIIKEHGGDITALSEEGKGTTFLIKLPVVEQQVFIDHIEHKKEQSDYKISDLLEKKRILVIEDEEIVVDLIKDILEEANARVDIACDGEEGQKKIETNDYDLVICDIKMPNMDGRKFYDEIKTKNPALSKRIIFITGDQDSKTANFLKGTGNKFLRKPFTIDELKNLINHAC